MSVQLVGLNVRIVHWDGRLWLALEAFLPRDQFATALQQTVEWDPSTLEFMSLKEWIEQHATDQSEFAATLGGFVLPDDVSVAFDLSDFLGTAVPDWYDTRRLARIVTDPVRFAKDNGESELVDMKPWLFCHHYNEQLRLAIAQAQDSDQVTTIAAGLWQGRDLAADRSAVDTSESSHATANDVNTIMSLCVNPFITNSQGLNGLTIGLPTAYDQSKPYPLSLRCRLSSKKTHVDVEISLQGAQAAQTASGAIASAVVATEYPDLTFEAVDWRDWIAGEDVPFPFMQVTTTRSWSDYALVHQISTPTGEESYFRIADPSALRSSVTGEQHLFLRVPQAADAMNLKFKLGTVLDGRIESVRSVASATSPSWRFLVEDGSLDALGELAQHTQTEPYQFATDTRLVARFRNGSFADVGHLDIASRGLALLANADQWVIFVSVAPSHDPQDKDLIGYSLFLPSESLSPEEISGSAPFAVSMYYPARWNAIRLKASDLASESGLSNIQLVRLARAGQVTFAPTTTTDVLDVRLRANSHLPWPLDTSGQPQQGDYFEWLARDARGFVGLRLVIDPSEPHWLVRRTYPQSDGPLAGKSDVRTWRSRVVASWQADPEPLLASARFRVRAAGTVATVRAALSDGYSRFRPLGRNTQGSAELELPLRIGTFPAALSSIVAREKLAVPTPIPVPVSGALEFLLTVSLSQIGSTDLYSVQLALNEHLLQTSKNLDGLWDAVADTILAFRIDLHFFELELDNRQYQSGFLTLNGRSPQTIDVTSGLKAELKRLMGDGKGGSVPVQIPLQPRYVGRTAESSTHFACALETIRDQAVLAINDCATSQGPAQPILILHETGLEPTFARDPEITTAFKSYQSSVATEFAPTSFEGVPRDNTLEWQRDATDWPCGGLQVPARALWALPKAADALATTRLVGFACVSPLLPSTGRDSELIANISQVIRLLAHADVPFFASNPTLWVHLVRELDAAITWRGPSEPQWGYEDTASGGAWTRLLDALACRFDTLHGDLGHLTSDPDSALPDLIPKVSGGVPLGNRSDAIGHLLRETLVKAWRSDPTSIWNQSAVWVTSLSNKDGLNADEVTRRCGRIEIGVAATSTGVAAMCPVPLGGRRPALGAVALDRRKFPAGLNVTGAAVVPLQTTDMPPQPVEIISFRLPVGDLGSSSPAPLPSAEIPLPSTEALNPPVVEAIGVESDAINDTDQFGTTARTFIVNRTEVSRRGLSLGLLQAADATVPNEDRFMPVGFAAFSNTQLPTSLLTYRSVLVSIKGDPRLRAPFERDRVTLARRHEFAAARFHGSTVNPWAGLAEQSADEVATYVDTTLRQYAPDPFGMVKACESLGWLIDELKGRLSQLSPTQVRSDDVAARISFAQSASGVIPAITVESDAPKRPTFTHLSVLTLQKPSSLATARATNGADADLWLFITFGFPVTASAELLLVHDRDGLWTNPGAQLIDPKYVQSQDAELSRLLRPQAQEIHVVAPQAAAISHRMTRAWTIERLLRASANPIVTALADLLALEEIIAGTQSEVQHLYLRLSLAVAAPAFAATIDPVKGVVLSSMSKSLQSARWTHGLTVRMTRDELIQSFQVEGLHTSTRMYGTLTILSSLTERPVVTIEGLSMDVTP